MKCASPCQMWGVDLPSIVGGLDAPAHRQTVAVLIIHVHPFQSLDMASVVGPGQLLASANTRCERWLHLRLVYIAQKPANDFVTE